MNDIAMWISIFMASTVAFAACWVLRVLAVERAKMQAFVLEALDHSQMTGEEIVRYIWERVHPDDWTGETSVNLALGALVSQGLVARVDPGGGEPIYGRAHKDYPNNLSAQA